MIERVWRSHSDDPGEFRSIAACHWGMVVTRLRGTVSLTVRGPETKATMADLPAEGEWYGVLFKLGAFMPHLLPGDLRDRNDLTLPTATKHSFWLNGSTWEMPSFENIETFVGALVRKGLIVTDHAVAAALGDEPHDLRLRTAQRRIMKLTGLSRTAIRQIRRAREAALLLQAGVPIPEVVFGLGYYDQSHLTHAMRRYIGMSPVRLAKGTEQLSLLYKTSS